MSDRKLDEPPTPDSGDAAYSVMQTLAGLVPGAPQLLQWLVVSPLEVRRDRWMREVGEAILELQAQQRIDIDELQATPQFIDIVLSASQIALRTSHDEKRRALRNAILNTALAGNRDADRRLWFLGLLDSMTPWQITILHFLHRPSWPGRDEIWRAMLEEFQTNPLIKMEEMAPRFSKDEEYSQMDALINRFPELADERDFCEATVRELFNRGLVPVDHINSRHQGFFTLTPSTSRLGAQFIEFITDPAM